MTAVWGDKHVEMWRRASLKSLSFPDNKKAFLENKTTWHIFTEDKHFDYIEKHIYAFLPSVEVKLRSKKDLRRYIDPVQSAAILMIEECIRDEAKLIMAPPDTIFGNGSILGLLSAGSDRGSCVVVPHARVLPHILEESLLPYVTNAELVTMAWTYLHKSWTDAEIGHPIQNSFVGGVAWKKIGEKMFAVQHRLPTVYLADFTQDDLNYFKVAISSGHWDHMWPGDILIPKGRQRFIKDSDEAFMVEITEADKNVPPIWPGPVDGFWRNHLHNIENAKVWSKFRGE